METCRRIFLISTKYDLSSEGFFGVRSGRFVRNIFGQDPLETMIDFVSRAILHAKIIPMKNGHGYRAVFSDGFEIDYRETSSSDGTPAIELWIRKRTRDSSSTVSVTISDQTFSIRYQKIHFVQEESSDSKNDN